MHVGIVVGSGALDRLRGLNDLPAEWQLPGAEMVMLFPPGLYEISRAILLQHGLRAIDHSKGCGHEPVQTCSPRSAPVDAAMSRSRRLLASSRCVRLVAMGCSRTAALRGSDRLPAWNDTSSC